MKAIDAPGGVFVDGNPVTGTRGTIVRALWLNQLQGELLAIQDAAGLVQSDTDSTQVLQAILKLLAAKAPLFYSISALPTQDVGPITVIEAGEVWLWTQTAYYTGYRSPLCGRPLDGHTATPLPSEVDAVGGLLDKTAYARLWGYAQENSLVVSQTTWSANIGAHYFVDVSSTQFRAPDLRNMFRRYTGTDADTANARALGSRQAAQLQSHAHNLRYSNTAAASGGNQSVLDGGGALTYTTLTAGGAETRPVNAAYHPRIHA